VSNNNTPMHDKIDIDKAIGTINQCVSDLVDMEKDIDRFEILEATLGTEGSGPATSATKITAYCNLKKTRAAILQAVIATNLKLVAKVIPDAAPIQLADPGEGDLDAITAKDSILERASSFMQNKEPAGTAVKRLN